MATKKVKQFAKFGARYGVGIRRRLLKVEPLQRKKQTCPFCGFEKATRTSTGIYECRKCSHVFTGGAYLPETNTGKTIRKMVEQKSFMPNVVELLSAKEEVSGAEPGPEPEPREDIQGIREEKPSRKHRKERKEKHRDEGEE